jgi:protein tyrosine phosphatase type 4A
MYISNSFYRAPVLVAIALIERANMKPLDAIQFIRKCRRGAINAKQMQFIEKYKPRLRGKTKCLIM